MPEKRILITNVDKLTQKSLYELLCRHDYKVDVVESVRDALSSIDQSLYQVIVTDVDESGGSEFLRRVKEGLAASRVIILASYGNMEAAIDCMKMGAFDYLVRPVEDKKIISSIERAIAGLPKTAQDSILFRKQGKKDGMYHGLVGNSRAMTDIYSVLDRISSSKATVLLRGESGTGKRLIAHALHKADRRRHGKPFVEISCGALPREIIESELFGHSRGAFTGAVNDRKGRFELADGGTILLDDIDSMSLDLQVKLLRVLQHKEFERVGENNTRKVDVRIIASTNQDLEKEVANKRFREDLYYRLNVISINVPPLRERKDDLPGLAGHFMNRYAEENHKKIKGISPELLEILSGYSWPGNVRELENIIERAVILDMDCVITEEDLPEIILNRRPLAHADLKLDAKKLLPSLKDALQEPEKIHIMRILEEVGWNKKKAANKLGVNRTTLYNKLRKYNINSQAVLAVKKSQ